MTDTNWEILAQAIKTLENPPRWLEEIACLNYAEISRLSKLDNACKGETARPSVREIVVEEEYLDFLREQIRLEPRGPEWTVVLQRRLNALQPFVGEKILDAAFYKTPHSVTLKINPKTGKLFLVEMY